MQENCRPVHGRTHRQSREGSPSFITNVILSCLADVFGQMLDDLVVAVESETQVVDIGRVSGFMQKVSSPVKPRSWQTSSLY